MIRQFLLASLLLLAGCHSPVQKPVPLPPPDVTHHLVVLTYNGGATRFEAANGQAAGMQNDLVDLFALQYGYQVDYVTRDDVAGLLAALRQGQAHLLAADLIPARDQLHDLAFGSGYFPVHQVVVCNTDGIHPESIADLPGLRVATMAGSWHVDALRAARLRVPALRWQEATGGWEEGLLEQVAKGDLDVAVVDSATYDRVRHLYANLDVAFDLPPDGNLAWILPQAGSLVLRQQVNAFFAQIARDGRLKQIVDRYYGYANRLEDQDVGGILQRMHDVLPKYRKIFYEAQQLTGIDWRLLAAISYQESHWDPQATSPTGVRGMMMMTVDTADKMGVDDRLDARQSVLGGARYLQELIDQLGNNVDYADRIWMALAAYNQGQGHLDDARNLALSRHLNPRLWCDVKRTLPQLSAPGSHGGVRHGYCRGGEAVAFVESVRTYYDILQRYEKPWQPPLADFASPAK